MDINNDIDPATDFKREAAEFFSRLKASGRPVVLSINGEEEVAVEDAKSYQRLLELAERLETIQAVKEGLASADRGEGRSVDELFDELEQQSREKIRL